MENYEQRYKEALERAKCMHEQGMMPERLEYVFPELKESEDEKIRKKIIDYFVKEVGLYPGEDRKEHKWLRWLEKQGEQKPTWSEEDEKIRYAICDTLDRIDERIMEHNHQLTHQQVKDWLKSLKDRCLPQPQQKWSEKDEKMLKSIISDYDDMVNESEGFAPLCNRRNWLKSIKERCTWKPSDEQMKFLWKYAEQNNYDGAILTSLYCDLKKLREE